MTKRFGFTLAEVLITLGIIGVVAAMTMPTLMNSTQGAQYKAAYKKALSALSQAITLNVALDEIDFGDIDTTNTMTKILSQRMNVVRTTTAASEIADYTIAAGGADGVQGVVNAASGNTTLFMNDGMMFQFPTTVGQAANAKCTKDTSINTDADWEIGSGNAQKCGGFIDVNGTKGPNKVVSCDNGTGTAAKPCKVTNPTDIYPVYFFDTSVLPATQAAQAVLYGK